MKKAVPTPSQPGAQYESIFGNVSSIIDAARRSAARWVNTVMQRGNAKKVKRK